jgi:hypothetical protein
MQICVAAINDTPKCLIVFSGFWRQVKTSSISETTQDGIDSFSKNLPHGHTPKLWPTEKPTIFRARLDSPNLLSRERTEWVSIRHPGGHPRRLSTADDRVISHIPRAACPPNVLACSTEPLGPPDSPAGRRRHAHQDTEPTSRHQHKPYEIPRKYSVFVGVLATVLRLASACGDSGTVGFALRRSWKRSPMRTRKRSRIRTLRFNRLTQSSRAYMLTTVALQHT